VPAWFWPSIVSVLVAAAVVYLVALARELGQKAEKLKATIDQITLDVDALLEAAGKSGIYQAPANNLSDSPVETTQAWLKRRNATERNRAARQRRLISRLSKRK
jgi:hypothetical protein